MLDLAIHKGGGLRKSSEIARARNIPPRFLEVILSQLKGSGFVKSKRGYQGGYTLIPEPAQITVGEVLRFMDREERPLHCIACISKCKCSYDDGCAFSNLWSRVEAAIYRVYDGTTLQDLMDNESAMTVEETG